MRSRRWRGRGCWGGERIGGLRGLRGWGVDCSFFKERYGSWVPERRSVNSSWTIQLLIYPVFKSSGSSGSLVDRPVTSGSRAVDLTRHQENHGVGASCSDAES